MDEISEAARKELNDYMKNWRAANKEKIRKSNQRYWERKAMLRQKERAIDGKTDDQR